MDTAIAPVTSAEVPILLELIRELARFEHLEHEVQATVESLNGSLFGPQPVAGALLARCDGEAAGYAIYFFTFSSFVGRAGLWLEDVLCAAAIPETRVRARPDRSGRPDRRRTQLRPIRMDSLELEREGIGILPPPGRAGDERMGPASYDLRRFAPSGVRGG